MKARLCAWARYRRDRSTGCRACLPHGATWLCWSAAARMTRHALRSWRWRVLWLRAVLDAELHASGGAPTRRSERCMQELTCI
jgi:hypothetical protein